MARQRLGQHFLSSAAWRERIARLALGSAALLPSSAPGTPAADAAADAAAAAAAGSDGRGGLWIEIGAGHGEMTALLARQAARLIAIELDPRLLPRLREHTAALPNVTIVPGDILALDLAALAGGQRFRVYGNLPYYITSPIVHRLLAHAARIDAAFLVVQLEVAERIAARPGGRDYGYLSAFTQFYSRPEILLRIPRGAFQPPPKVDSALVALHLPGEGTQFGIENETGFMEFLKACFAHKRKTLRNNLRALVPQERAAAILRECGIAPSARAEQIGLAEFARIFAALAAAPKEVRGEEDL